MASIPLETRLHLVIRYTRFNWTLVSSTMASVGHPEKAFIDTKHGFVMAKSQSLI